MRKFRIHGDNIVECERITDLIINEAQPISYGYSLCSPSTTIVDLNFEYYNEIYTVLLELLPGFNKSGRSRWESDIFDILRSNGSFLDETPDAIITQVNETDNTETIICAIEFCSALQAGNQAWQRSGRAFSTGRTGCPYIYIVDFVKYELDSRTRERKNLRFPNPVVPYSYISFSENNDCFVAQVYVRSEEFDKTREPILANFDEDNFADKELAQYIAKKLCGLDTSSEERAILRKNLEVVQFLASGSDPAKNFTVEQWEDLYTSGEDIIDYATSNAIFNFHKTITAKGHHGNSPQFIDLVDRYSVGLASKDLPFGIIPKENRFAFAEQLSQIYPNFDSTVVAQIGSDEKDLILCILKGFKPRGDDNRPDRGLLPLVSMLSNADSEVMTYVYGPLIDRNYELLIENPTQLAASNGLWKTILALDDFVVLDVPILDRGRHGLPSDISIALNTKELKSYYTENYGHSGALSMPLFSSKPTEYHEDDVDTGIHFIFDHLLGDACFEGMCNPPGGDWSGFSIINEDTEYRWLSLPRVSDDIDGKRPDHILQLFGVFDMPLLLIIESKERSCDLEHEVGYRLKNYVQSLLDFTPSVEKAYGATPQSEWRISDNIVNYNVYETVSAAAYLRSSAQDNDIVYENSKCDMLFIMAPMQIGWNVEIVTYTEKAATLKQYIVESIDSDFVNIY